MRLHVFSLNALPLLPLQPPCSSSSAACSSSTGSTSRWSASRCPRSTPTCTSRPRSCSGSSPATCSGTAACCCSAGATADLLGRRRTLLIALGVFTVASALGGLVDNGTLLVVTRFLKGAAAAFTAPAGLSIITTTFAEGPERNRALSIYTATGASGFSLGLVLGGILTELGWRWTFLLPVPIALALLAIGPRVIPHDRAAAFNRRRFDVPGALTLTTGMLLLVRTIVEAPDQGWTSAQTIGAFALSAVAAVALRRHRAPLRLAARSPRASCARARSCAPTSA